MDITLNEREVVEKALNEGYIDIKVSSTLKPLIKHYFSIEMSSEQVRESVEEFMKLNFPNFNSVKFTRSLDNWVKSESKRTEHKLFEVKDIKIYKNEIEKISELNDKELEKLAFSYLVCCKIYNQKNNNDKNWVNSSRKSIFKDSKIAKGLNAQRLLVSELIHNGFIESSSNKNSRNKRVLFIDETGEVEIVLNDFRNYIYEYLKWKGEKIGECESCGIRFRKTGKNHHMCGDCWKEKEKIIKKEWDQTKRKR